MTDWAHDFLVYRYDHGGNSTIYVTDYNGTYTGVLGLRMDLNNTDYGGAFMTGPPMLWTGAARYPLMHGETGPFNFVDITTEQPSGTGISSTSGFNPMAAKADARADIVCVLASDGIGPGGVMGVAYKYSNLTPIANPSIGVGRGPNPQPNDIHRSIYSHVLSNGTFSAHEGELISGVSTPYTGGFVGGDLDPNRVINSTTSSLAAYYSFSNSPDDISTNDGTEMGGWKYGADRNNAPNRAGNATSGHVQVTDDPSLDLPNGFSFGAWVYWDSLAGTQTILSKAGEFKLEVMNNGSELWVELYDGSAPDPYRGRSTAVNFKTHTWYLVYFAYDNVADQKDLYVNGFAVGCNDQVGTFVGPLLAAGNNLLMGADAGPSNYVQGLVDEVRIYRIGLSAAQILDLYQVERAPPTFDSNQGLVAYYPFTDGGLTDSSTEGNDATSAGAPLAVSDRHGSLGADDAYQLSAGNNINTQTSNGFPWWPSSPIPDPSVSNADFTLSLWLAKPAGGSFGGNNRAIVANQSPRQFQLEVGDNNWLRFYTGFAAGGPDCQVNLTWSPSTWYHVVVTRVGNQIKIYRDGLLRVTNTTTDVNMATVAEAFLTFGEDPSSPGRELDGSIDDVRLYDHGINDLDVQDLYLQERAAMSGPIFDLTAGLTVHYPISASPPFNDTTSQVRDVVSMTFSTVSGPATLEEGRYGAQDANGSYPFGGADFINMGKTMPNICDGPFTISFWANATALPAPGNTFDIMGNRDIAPDPANSWWISVNNAGAITFNADDGMNPVAVATSGTGALVVNTWRHIVITRSAGRRVNIYVNGISPGGPEDTGPGPDIPNALDDLYAGRAGPLGASGFQGKLDEIRIYENTELLPWQADVLFNAEDVNIVGSATIKINFGLSDPSDFGDSVLLELFANTPTGVPFHSMDYNASGSSIVHSFSAASQAGAWQDRQGVWRITCLSGSVFISSVEITVNGESFVYYGNITPPHTLAPSSFESHLHMNRDTWSAMVVRLNHGITGYTFPHELGHVLGLNHGNGDDQGQGPLTGEEPEVVFNPHGHISVQGGVRTGNGNFVRDEFLSMGNHFMAFGTQAGGGYYGQPGGTGTFGLYSTIMAYTFDSGNPNKYAKVPRFASPNVTYKGGITGDNHGRMLPPPQGRYDRPLYFDAVRTLRVVGQGATFYRDDNGSGRLEASWSVPTRPITSVPDPGGVTDKKPDSDTTVARAGDPGGSGSADVARAKGGSSPVPDPNSGRANPARGDDSPRVTLAQGSGLPGKSGGGGIGGSTGIPTEPEQPSRPEPGKPPPVEPGPKRPKPIPRPIPGKRTNFGGKTGVSVPNDSRRHSLPLVLRRMADRSYGVSINGHNLGATGGEDAAASTDDGRRAFHGRSVWWHAVVPAAGVYDLQADTRGSGIDTTLGVWLEDNDKLESLGVNDNDPRRTGPASAVRRRGVTLRKGQKVLFGLDGVNGAQGRVRLNVRLKPVR